LLGERQRLSAGCEGQVLVPAGVEQLSYPEWVACGYEGPGRSMPDDEGEIAEQLRDIPCAVSQYQAENQFEIARWLVGNLGPASNLEPIIQPHQAHSHSIGRLGYQWLSADVASTGEHQRLRK
jgi:hypothetical protein